MSITERVDAITLLTDDRASSVTPIPRSVKIEVTGRCNFKCSFCAHTQRLREVSEMDKDFYKRVVAEMRGEGVEELGVFYLGESFLCSWLPEAIDYAKSECGYPYVFLTTNGSISTPEKMEACMAAGLDSLKFSLNYASQDQFVSIARVKPKLFDKIAEHVKAAYTIRQENEYKCGLYGSYIQYDGDQGNRMKAYVDDLAPYLDEVYALPLYNQASLVNNPDWEFVQGNRGRADALRDPLPCWSLFTEGHISFDGSLSACCFDHDQRFSMGNLHEVSFKDAWNSEKFQELRSAHLKKDVRGTVCEQCVVF